jgi:uncharacterized Zn finger protein
MRENYARKAQRLLAEGRVSVLRIDPSGVTAIVRGDTAAFYTVSFDGSRWDCSCPAIGRCSHAFAVQRVVVTEGAWTPPLVGSPA